MFPLEHLLGRVIIAYPNSTDHTCPCQHPCTPVVPGMLSLTVGEPPSQQCLLPTCQVFPSRACSSYCSSTVCYLFY